MEKTEMMPEPRCPYCHCHLNIIDAHGLGCPWAERRVVVGAADDKAEAIRREKRFGVAFYAGLLVFVAAMLVCVCEEIARAW